MQSIVRGMLSEAVEDRHVLAHNVDNESYATSGGKSLLANGTSPLSKACKGGVFLINPVWTIFTVPDCIPNLGRSRSAITTYPFYDGDSPMNLLGGNWQSKDGHG